MFHDNRRNNTTVSFQFILVSKILMLDSAFKLADASVARTVYFYRTDHEQTQII
jgi:hypothetical protein